MYKNLISIWAPYIIFTIIMVIIHYISYKKYKCTLFIAIGIACYALVAIMFVSNVTIKNGWKLSTLISLLIICFSNWLLAKDLEKNRVKKLLFDDSERHKK